jgi:D-tyrosyl-tRNA(Tyr) deacylase
MRAVIQRVGRAAVSVDGDELGRIDQGLLVLLGVGRGDGAAEIEWMVRKLAEVRVFADEDGRMNRSLEEVQGDVLLVSQFTLHGDVRKGRRPSYTDAAPPELAEPLIEAVRSGLEARGLRVATGRFGAMMDVELVNQGPVTLILDTP